MGNPLLSKKAKKVKKTLFQETTKTTNNLTDTMRAQNLIWISANQIWISMQVFVTKFRKKLKYIDQLRVFVNPNIIRKSKQEVVMYEWCWSVAYSKLFWPVKRTKKIIIKACDEYWESFSLKADGLLNRVIQHEYDHLQWVSFIEKITDYKKLMSAEGYIKRMVKKK